MKHLSGLTSQVTKHQFSRKYMALGKIVNCWAEIIGEGLADKAQPVKIQYRRQRSKKDKPSATLEVACASADATMMHYQKDLILARINRIFGDQWVSDLKFVPVERAPATLSRRKRIHKRPLQEQDHDFLRKTLGQVEDDAVKERLERLGQSILKEEELA